MIFIHIAGHLGQDPEVRFTPSGQKVTSIRVATNIRRSNKEKTVWWKVTMWGDRFDKRLAYLKKGSAVMVWGEMGFPDTYQDKEGNQQTSFEVIAEHISFSPFGGKDRQQGADAGEGDAEEQPQNRFGGQKPQAVAAVGSSSEDDVPF